MPIKKNSNSQQETEDEKWERSYLSTREKSYITEAVHSMEKLPNERDLDHDSLRKVSLNVCLLMKHRNSKWERFLTKKGNLGV